jgi:UPF0755 protein
MKKIIKISIIFILLISLFFVYLSLDNKRLNKANCEEKIIFSISKGENFLKIGDNLVKENVIKNSFSFKFHSLLSQKYKSFKAGNYLLCSNENVLNIIDKIYRGDIYEKKITIVDGWNLNDIALYFENLKIIEKDFFLNNYNQNKFNSDFIFLKEKPEESTLEGYLFPDTYLVPYDSDIDSIIKTILSNFRNKLSDEIQDDIKKQGKSIFEIITVASLIEKEVRSYEDKRLVSGIIWKRLEIGMPLQIDATVVYITGKKSTKVSIAETKIESPYNTYRYRGLPVGPICNPGIESIKAAVYPEKSNYLFYLSKLDGETVFSERYQDHLIAKNKYLK